MQKRSGLPPIPTRLEWCAHHIGGWVAPLPSSTRSPCRTCLAKSLFTWGHSHQGRIRRHFQISLLPSRLRSLRTSAQGWPSEGNEGTPSASPPQGHSTISSDTAQSPETQHKMARRP
eukprot:scaffold60729_cov16-Tisochrysis_lutea.AAC.1